MPVLCRFFALSPLLLLPLSVLLMAFPDGPYPKMTGGFQDETCLSCHQSFDLNSGRALGGTFRIEGAPQEWQAGRTYPLKVVLAHPGQSRWGFELSSRFAETGSQAGVLTPGNDGFTQLESEDGIQFMMQTEEGTRAGTLNGPVEFSFSWTAPDSGQGMILFNAAGNASDNKNDEEGDYIYTASSFSLPSSTPGVPVAAGPSAQPAATEIRAPRRHRVNESATLINVPIPLDRRQHEVNFLIQHRFAGEIDEGIGNLFGVDLGANISLGFSYSPTSWLTAELSRERFGQRIVLAGRAEIFHNPESFFAMDLRGGVEARRNFQDNYATFFQLPTSLDLKRARFYATPTMLFNTRFDSEVESGLERGLPFINPEDNHTFSLGLGGDLAISPTLSVMGEFMPRLAGFGGPGDNDQTHYGAGVKIRTRGHVFSIFITRGTTLTPATYGVNAGGPAAGIDDVMLGFNIVRRRN